MGRYGPRMPTPRWESLIQLSLQDAVARSVAVRESDAAPERGDARELIDLIAKAASEVEHHRDAAVATRLQLQAMHASAAPWQQSAGRDDAKATAAEAALEAAGGRGPGLDIRR
jgi:hypothetical protein